MPPMILILEIMAARGASWAFCSMLSTRNRTVRPLVGLEVGRRSPAGRAPADDAVDDVGDRKDPIFFESARPVGSEPIREASGRSEETRAMPW